MAAVADVLTHDYDEDGCLLSALINSDDDAH